MEMTDIIKLSNANIMAICEVIKASIESCENLDNAILVNEKINELITIQPTATEAQASAKFNLLLAINDELDRQAKLLKDDKIPPSIKKMRADSKCAEQHYICELINGLNSDLTHAIDVMRSKLSYFKQDLMNINYGN